MDEEEMSRTMRAVLSFFSVLLLSGAAFGIDVKLERLCPSDAERNAHPFDYTLLEKTTDPPTGAWKLPDLLCATPVYAYLQLGAKKRLLVLDVEKGSDRFYNRVWFDANGNQDLTDDPPVQEERLSEPFAYSPSFAFRDIPIGAGGAVAPYSFRVYLSYRGPKSRIPSASSIKRSLQVFAASDTWYSGEFEHKGKRYEIRLGDGDADGSFGDAPAVPDIAGLRTGAPVALEGDRIVLSAGGEIDTTQFQVLGSHLVLDGDAFKTAVDTGKSVLSLEPVAEGLAGIEFGMDIERLVLFAEGGPACVTLFHPGKTCKVPAGTYRLAGYRALRKDAQGDLWAVTAAAVKETPPLRAAAGQKAVLELGEPYRVFAEVPEWSIRSVQGGRDQASVEFHIQGAAKEKVIDLIRLNGDKSRIPLSKVEKNRPAEAAFKVMKDGGELVAEGHFEYG
jgi:hypothetical protein